MHPQTTAFGPFRTCFLVQSSNVCKVLPSKRLPNRKIKEGWDLAVSGIGDTTFHVNFRIFLTSAEPEQIL